MNERAPVLPSEYYSTPLARLRMSLLVFRFFQRAIECWVRLDGAMPAATAHPEFPPGIVLYLAVKACWADQ